MDDELIGLALVVVLAIGAQLLAARLVIPAIVPLLVVGVLAGDVLGLIDPQALLGPAFSDAISLAVGIILFEGALGLRREELSGPVRPVVWRLVTLGALVTWICCAILVELLLDVPRPIAILIGAIVIVSGPTVVLPMLDFVRPIRQVRSVLKWEGIIVDPVGAIAAVIVFNALDFSGGGISLRISDFAGTLAVGLGCGIAGALVLMPLLQARWLAERQKVAATLMAVVGAFAAADVLRDDAGLVATIVMGIVLANQRRVDIERIVEFKETLGAILLGLLFVLLSATVDLSDVIGLGWPALALIALIVAVVRPLAVLLSSWRTGLPRNERAFVALLAPRGIVAASTASIFGLQLTQEGAQGAELIVPIVFTVIAGTVAVYAVLAPLAARLLGLTHGEPAGVLVVGAAPWARDLALGLSQARVDVRVWTPDPQEAAAARAAGLVVLADPLLGEDSVEEDPLDQAIGTVLVTTADDALNELLAERLADALGAAHVFALPAAADGPQVLARDRTLEPALFGEGSTADALARRHAAGERVQLHGSQPPAPALPLAAVRESVRNGALAVLPYATGHTLEQRAGDVYLALGPPSAAVAGRSPASATSPV